MRGIRKGFAALALVLAGALIAGLAWNLVHTQAGARAKLREELARRGALTAKLIGSAFKASSSPAAVRAKYGGSPHGLSRAVAGVPRPADRRVLVLDAGGHVLAAAPPQPSGDPVAGHWHLQAALHGGVALSDAFRDTQGGWVIEIAVPISTQWGGRVVAGAAPISLVSDFTDGFFASASATPGSLGYLLDGTGRTLSATDHDHGATPGRALMAALARSPHGTYGNRTYVSAAVPSSHWRVILTVPTASLYGSVVTGAAWALFAALSAAVCALLGLGLAAARGARRLAAATEREHAARALAHARLHDALTGLPNRALFQDRAEHALATARRRGCAARRRVPRHRPLQAHQRLAGPRGRRRGAARGRAPAGRLRPHRQHGQPLRRRRVHPAVRGHGRRGRAAARCPPARRRRTRDRGRRAVRAGDRLDRRRRARRGRGSADGERPRARRRRRDVPRQGARPRARRGVRPRAARARARAAGRRGRAAARDRRGRAARPLPADRRTARRRAARRRGARALAAPRHRRARGPGRVHRARRGDRPDRVARRVGAAHGGARRRRLGALRPDRRRVRAVGQRVRQSAGRLAPARGRRRRAGGLGAALVAPVPRDHRDRGDARSAAVRADARAARGARRAARARRLRRRPLLARPAGAHAADHRAQARPLVRGGDERDARPRDRAGRRRLARALDLVAVAEGVESAEQARELAAMGFPLAQGYYFGRSAERAQIVKRLGGLSPV